MQIIKIGLINENKIEFIGNYIVVPTGIIIAILMMKKKIFWKEKSLLSID
jgi:hypothetical protein